MDIQAYLAAVSQKYASGQATEHSYRPALQALFESIDPTVTVINEPKKSEAGMPDFLFERKGVPVGWAEAKDVDKDVIRLKGYSVDQRKRYERAYANLLYTNGVDFEFIEEGKSNHVVSIADFMGALGGLQPRPEAFGELERQLRRFVEAKPISVTSAAKLAELMAAKAAIIKDEVGIALKDDPDFRTGLGGQYKSFKANLLPALEPDEFADIYAETITYGMFAARFHDDDLTTFSRTEALEKLPASNPFLKGLFEYIAGAALPNRLRYIVDDLVALMRASDPHALFEGYGKFTARNDPFVHFYEDFLAAYNPKKRKSRGVWYTPEPVVDFIVRAVDDVLKTEFGLPDGLADSSKVTVDWDMGRDDPKTGKPVTEKREVHKVQILDPATGTGTFLAKAVQLIADRVKPRAPGKWSGYVEKDLLPRLHGFELLMASYAMCHMKLDMQLTESGYKPGPHPPRLSVWLTNALEPAEREVRDLFFQPLAEEARGASEVKRQTPIMCVIGNPPYSGESANKGAHIMALMEAYKKEPGGKERLKERNPKWINDDYVKFIRMAEDLIARNPSGGVLGFITNHGYLDNPTFRGMRWHLLKTFDKIWVLDLHGSTKKDEKPPNGQPDQNVFDILPGVAVIIGVWRGGSQGQSAELSHGEFWGTRKQKNGALWESGVRSVCAQRLPTDDRFLAFVPRNIERQAEYQVGFSLTELMPLYGVGVISKRDDLTIHMDKESAFHAASDILAVPRDDYYRKYSLPEDVRDWRYDWAKNDVAQSGPDSSLLRPIYYRLFDRRFIYYTGRARGFVGWPTTRVMRHFNERANVGLCFNRTIEGGRAFADIFAVDGMIQHHATSIKEVNYLAPLYLAPDEQGVQAEAFASLNSTPNLDPKLYAAICAAAGIDPADQAGPDDDFRAATGAARPSEVKVFDYIYGVLHSPDYRRTYAEFLKIDFPRIPYPASPEVFAHVSEKGEALRRLHLMEPAAVGDTPYPFLGMEEETDEELLKARDIVAPGYPKYERGGVWINPHQHFADVPETAWTFPIGGYLPAQKWLKDRRGRELSYEDVTHYQRIVKILMETDRIMQEIKLPLD